jgi:hypothetical protein
MAMKKAGEGVGGSGGVEKPKDKQTITATKETRNVCVRGPNSCYISTAR